LKALYVLEQKNQWGLKILILSPEVEKQQSIISYLSFKIFNDQIASKFSIYLGYFV
jgi:hypothetical protein